jgi:hypothetical protein
MVMIRAAFATLMFAHGLIHGLGFLKAFGLAELEQLSQPLSKSVGVLWLLAGLAVEGSALAVYVAPRSYWLSCAMAVLLSQGLIVASWRDAKMGTLANVVLLLAAVYGFFSEGPFSFHTRFLRASTEGRARLSALPPPGRITEANLSRLPHAVARYIERAGFLGQAETRSYELRFSARMRASPSAPWMNASAEQVSFADAPTRLFLMRATRFGLPIEAFHHYEHGKATFQVKLLGVITIVDARGPELDRTETVTLFNDMCLLAPATLLSPQIRWESLDDGSVRAHFSNGGNTISAQLFFDESGFLRDFVSDDRKRSSADGKIFTAQRFSTPIVRSGHFGRFELMAEGEARWHAEAPEGSFAYGVFQLEDIRYNDASTAP